MAVIHLHFRVGNYYRPQTKLWKGYDFTPVCHSVHRGGGGLPQCMLGYTPHWTDTPDQTPPSLWVDNPSLWADTPPSGQTPPRRQTPQQTATAADGTHPTGIHSC